MGFCRGARAGYGTPLPRLEGVMTEVLTPRSNRCRTFCGIPAMLHPTRAPVIFAAKEN